MQIATKQHEYHAGNVELHGAFQVANTAFMQELLSGIYSNPIKAVIRELSTNAYEAHLMANNPEPFSVTLPTVDNPTFHIRDYGTGLNKEDLTNLYTVYGKSTKRHTNEFAGGFGIGSKSPFTYTDMFQVISYHEGKKYVVVNSKSTSGKFCFHLMSETDTNEPNGIEIIIKVKPTDINAFFQEAKHVYKYFAIQPKCNLILDIPVSDYKFSFSDNKYQIANGRDSIVVMGPVAYPIQIDHFKDNIDKTVLLNACARINLNVGDVDIAPNREELKYTDLTKSVLSKCLKEISNFLNEEFTKLLTSCTTMWDAKVTANEVLNKFGFADIIRRGNVKWKGKQIQFYSYCSDPCISSKIEYDRTSSVKRTNKGRRRNIYYYLNRNTMFVLPDSRDYVARCKHFIQNNQDKTIYIVDSSNPNFDKFYERNDLVESNVIKSSTLAKAPVQPRNNTSRQSAGFNLLVEILNSKDIKSNCGNSMVNLNNHSGYYCTNESVKSFVERHYLLLLSENLITKENIIFLQPHHYKKVQIVKSHKNWENVDVLLEKSFQAAILQYGDNILKYKYIDTLARIDITQYNKDSIAYKIFTLHNNIKEHKNLIFRIEHLSSHLNKKLDSCSLKEILCKHYPLAPYIGEFNFAKKAVIDYFNNVLGDI